MTDLVVNVKREPTRQMLVVIWELERIFKREKS